MSTSIYKPDPLLIRQTQPDGEVVTRWADPKDGHWYVGVTADEKFGAVAKYEHGHFRSSAVVGPVDMSNYVYLIERPLAVVPPAAASILYHLRNIGDAVDQLYTLIKSPSVPWNPNQKNNATEILAKAQTSLQTLTEIEAEIDEANRQAKAQ
jgi:hypothetical protein